MLTSSAKPSVGDILVFNEPWQRRHLRQLIRSLHLYLGKLALLVAMASVSTLQRYQWF
ncbi:MAG: hypothetical protein ACOYEQ_05890 [Bacillota bacterium]